MDQQFSLSWNNFHGNLSKGFAGLLGNGEFVDVTIAVEGHLLQAHKVILSICSPYFKKMFQLNPCQHPIVVLRDVTHKAMRDLLQFMYHGEVSVKREDLTSFIGTAEVLQIKGLTNKETDEENFEGENVSKPSLENQVTSPDVGKCTNVYNASNNEMPDNCETDLLKQREFIEKLQRISSLKRKSEDNLQKKYYTDTPNTEKRSKTSEKPYVKINQIHQKNNFENVKSIFEESSVNITKSLNTSILQNNTEREVNDKSPCETVIETALDLKTECDDNDIIVSDPAVCTTPKAYDNSRDGNKVLTTPVEYQSPQDNCTGLSALFMDLKNLVNGKFTNTFGTNGNEEMVKHVSEHRLVTIPQKEDGKKKYPQRSCRLCWRIGKRRDTRFMCSCCELPFCKSPCFEIHFHDVFRVSQLQGDYYAT